MVLTLKNMESTQSAYNSINAEQNTVEALSFRPLLSKGARDIQKKRH